MLIATVMSRGTWVRAIAVVIGAALLMMVSACSVADRNLVRELRHKGREHGLGLIRVLNFRSDEITFEPMNRQQRDPFSWWYLMTHVSSPDGSAVIAIYDRLESRKDGQDFSLDDRRAGREKRLPPGVVLVDPYGNEIWNRPVEFHVDNLAISADVDKVALQGKEGLAYLSVGSNELHVVDPSAGESHFMSGRIAWSPAGDQIVYERDGKILVLDLASKQSKQLASGFDPSWSPDGRWIAFRSPEGFGVVMSPFEKESRVVLPGKKLSGALRWSPDSEYLLCSENDAAFLPARLLTEMTSQLVIYRIRDGAQYVIVSAIPVVVGEAFERIVKK
jgi:WD40 repeat protein